VEAGSLGVESGDVVGVESRGMGGLWGGRWCVETCWGMPVAEALRDGQLGGQGRTRGPLMCQGQGRDALALLGGSDDNLDGGDGSEERGGCGWSSHRGRVGVSPCGIGEARQRSTGVLLRRESSGALRGSEVGPGEETEQRGGDSDAGGGDPSRGLVPMSVRCRGRLAERGPTGGAPVGCVVAPTAYGADRELTFMPARWGAREAVAALTEVATEREMCPWAISKYFGDLVSNTSALV
jgi:hypothetical protein